MEVKPKMRVIVARIVYLAQDTITGIAFFALTELLALALRYCSHRLTSYLGVSTWLSYSTVVAEISLQIAGLSVLLLSLVRTVVRFARPREK